MENLSPKNWFLNTNQIQFLHIKNLQWITNFLLFKHLSKMKFSFSQQIQIYFLFHVLTISFQWDVSFTGFNTKTPALDTKFVLCFFLFFFFFFCWYIGVFVFWMYWKHSAMHFFPFFLWLCIGYLFNIHFIALHSLSVNAIAFSSELSNLNIRCCARVMVFVLKH